MPTLVIDNARIDLTPEAVAKDFIRFPRNNPKATTLTIQIPGRAGGLIRSGDPAAVTSSGGLDL